MENFLWSKALLKSYNRLDQVAEILDRTVLSRGLASQFSFNNTEIIAGKILSVIERKKTLVQIKAIIEECLSKLSGKYFKILALKYLDNMKFCEIAKVMDISMRSCFRIVNKAMEQFSQNLLDIGYDEEHLRLLVKNEPFIKTVYNEVLKDEHIMPFAICEKSYIYA